ncbi:hypothetical protein CAPTEDRAFT_202184 [Capitella teleta]|uniref:Reverse transcriptase domain-containing protein n=1 Tax=Capitella teleta TaxID=283909 RepID=R7TDQ8_CAPTE|nr:hypothetical protein CAPTEDRAFT_202184 [Capitella teleta]|eukprot:ELT91647.1 hypothetical protein CAPTEDRAFT_202184 [Capitella teleta]
MEKLRTLESFCEQYGMLRNQKKTKLMVINGQKEDRLPIELTGSAIGHITHYVYLGAYFTEDGKMASMMKHQLEACRKHVNKFAAFVQKNSNMPFAFKHKVLTAALSASMLYSCESWLTDNTSGVNKLYMATMTMLLSIEIGIPELKSTLLKRQGAFLRKFRQKSAGDEPLAHALNLVQREGMGQRLTDAAETDGDPELASLESIRSQCRQKAADGATRYQTYLEMNPDLCVHSI